MKSFVITLVVIGLAIVLVVGGGLSLVMEQQRRHDMRRRSAREAAARFRRRFGSNADRAVERMLEHPNISRRKRRFFKLIAGELQGHAAPAVERAAMAHPSNAIQSGTQT